MVEPLTKIREACLAVGRDPATVGITALIGLWFPDLQANKPSFFDNPLTGTVEEITSAMRGYAELGVQHIMFQCEPYSIEARRLLTEALQLYRGRGSHKSACTRNDDQDDQREQSHLATGDCFSKTRNDIIIILP